MCIIFSIKCKKLWLYERPFYTFWSLIFQFWFLFLLKFCCCFFRIFVTNFYLLNLILTLNFLNLFYIWSWLKWLQILLYLYAHKLSNKQTPRSVSPVTNWEEQLILHTQQVGTWKPPQIGPCTRYLRKFSSNNKEIKF